MMKTDEKKPDPALALAREIAEDVVTYLRRNGHPTPAIVPLTADAILPHLRPLIAERDRLIQEERNRVKRLGHHPESIRQELARVETERDRLRADMTRVAQIVTALAPTPEPGSDEGEVSRG